MVLLQGIQLPDQKKVKYALLSFYGISHFTSSRILAALSINEHATMASLSEAQMNALGQHLTTLTIENDLKRRMQGDIAHLRNTGTYRGRRHAMGLPVRGQNTQNNHKTARKLNRVERRAFSWYVLPLEKLIIGCDKSPSYSSINRPLEIVAKRSFHKS